AYDFAGFSLASAGDVNGDGVTDLLIGANGVNRGSNDNAGAAYVIYGKKTKNGEPTWGGLIDDPAMPGRKVLDIGTLKTEDGFMILGENQNGNFGRSVEGVGDVNGDGFDDIIVGAPTASGSGGTATAGSAYVILGSGTGQGAISDGRQILDVAAMTSAQGFIIRGVAESGASLGKTVGSAGDVNGDGLADIMVTAHQLDRAALNDNVGRAYVILGKNVGEGWGQSVSGQFILDLSQMGQGDGFSLVGRNALNEILGESFGDPSLLSPGDLNGDGIGDLFINASHADIFGRTDNGEGVFIYGSSGLGGLSLTGTNAANALNGGSLNDLINGLGGADSLLGFAGNDTLIIGDAGFVRVDGGTDTDTLRLAGTTGFGLNLSALAAGAIKDIERIDLVAAGSLNNSLTVTQQTLLDLSTTTDILKVLGGVGDTVTATGFAISGGILMGDGITYNIYKSGDKAELWVQSGVNVVGATQSAGYVLTGFAGNDTLIVGDASFGRVDGGTGTDTLRLAGTTGFSLVLSTLAAGAIKDIEQIDLVAGTLDNSLTVTEQSLRNLSTTTDLLKVLGGAGDTVNATGFATGGSIIENGINFTAYTSGLATLWVQQGVSVSDATSQSSGYVLTGLAGNETLIVGNTSFLRVDGGAGTDTLRLAGTAGFGLNLGTLAAGAIKDIEQIDLVVGGTLNNTLTVTEQSLIDLSSTTDFLKVLGDSGDTVTATGFVTGGITNENGVNYAVYTRGAATLWVQQGVKVAGAVLPLVITGMSNDYGTPGDFITDRNLVVLTGTGVAGSLIQLSISGLSPVSVKVDSAGLWESSAINLAALASGGTVTATIAALDADGNAGATAASQVITKQVIGDATTIDLATVTNTAGNLVSPLGFSFAGSTTGDRSMGFTTGDVGGDSRNDLILNSTNMPDGAATSVGGVAVVFGQPNWNNLGTFDLANLGTNGWLLRGPEAGAQLGHGGSSVIGDLNGDGKGELIAGALNADPGGITNAGAAYIVWGSTTPLGTLETNGANSRYVLKTTDVTQDKGFVFRGLTNTEQMGSATLGISSTPGNQDFNGDGIADFFIAARYLDQPLVTAAGGNPGQTAATDVGGVVVVFGQAPGSVYGDLVGNVREMTINNLTDLTKGFIIRGGTAYDFAGFSLASAGDVNGDGVTDLLIGANGVNRGSNDNAGAAYVIYG
ncbi:MAG: beta strand repeat-containing protein, partial [Sphingomonadaceae bacterium]